MTWMGTKGSVGRSLKALATLSLPPIGLGEQEQRQRQSYFNDISGMPAAPETQGDKDVGEARLARTGREGSARRWQLFFGLMTLMMVVVGVVVVVVMSMMMVLIGGSSLRRHADMQLHPKQVPVCVQEDMSCLALS